MKKNNKKRNLPAKLGFWTGKLGWFWQMPFVR